MFETLALVFVVLLVLSLLPLAFIAIRKALKERGPRVITCPENGCRAEVSLDAWRSGLSFAFGEERRQLSTCSRWPEMGGCDQACLSQIEESADGCLVRSVLSNWYEGRSCAYCGLGIQAFHPGDRAPALRTPEGHVLALSEVSPFALDAVLATHDSVCANCYDAMAFRERFPNLPVDRPRSEIPSLPIH
jgi:hypothetical protein